MASPTARLNDLLDAVAAGDRSALEQLYGLTRAKLYGTVLRILRRPELAATALQDAYLEVWRDAGNFDPRVTDPVVFLVATARRTALGLARKRGDSPLESDAPVLTEADEATPAQPKPSDDLKRLLGVLAGLSEDLRRMLLLAFYDGWGRKALSVEFDAAEGTIATWLRRSLAQIRDGLAQ